MYEWLYDDKRRFHVYQLSPEARRRFEQKGLREKLLCQDCENKIAKYERYVSLLLRGEMDVSVETTGNLVVVSRVDYRLFRLFLLSVLWRSSVSSLDFFSRVKLGPHEEKIRGMLENEGTSPSWRYGCILAAPLLNGEIQQGVIVQPTEARSNEGVRIYRFLFGGLAWLFFVSNHKHHNGIETASLTDQGELRILKTDIGDLQQLATTMSRLHAVVQGT